MNPFRRPAAFWLTETTIKSRVTFVLGELRKMLSDGLAILDLGEPNLITGHPAIQAEMKRHAGKIYNTNGDFNTDSWGILGDELIEGSKADAYKFKCVLCLEVFEHLANPLRFLQNLHQRMAKGGILFLTTPKATFRFLQIPDHLVEYDRTRLRALIEMSGCFEIIEMTTTKSGYPRSIFWRGFRPFCRAMFQKSQVVKAKAI